MLNLLIILSENGRHTPSVRRLKVAGWWYKLRDQMRNIAAPVRIEAACGPEKVIRWALGLTSVATSCVCGME